MNYLILTPSHTLGIMPAIPADICGHWHNGQCWRPDAVAIEKALPYRWRKAWKRCGGNFWFESRNNTAAAYANIYSTRGKHLATVYAVPQNKTDSDS